MAQRTSLGPSFFTGIVLAVLGLVFLIGWWQYLMKWGDGNAFVLDTDDLLLPSLLAWAVGLGLPFLGARLMHRGWNQGAGSA